MPRDDLLQAENHFEFGKNWASYSDLIDDEAVARAEEGLLKLVSKEELSRRSFLDIGCGSGLHSLAASRLGSNRILSLDIDEDSVRTTQKVMRKFASSSDWNANTASVFDLTPSAVGQFDVVYSWGVLHHTGDMWRAVDMAASLVSPHGLFAFALYRRTHLDWFWIKEKRWYSRATPRAQSAARVVYTLIFRVASLLVGRDFNAFVAEYKTKRGMDFLHDVHDWLGGYPYETATAAEVAAHMGSLGFRKVREFVHSDKVSIGWLGSGCDEYVYRKG